MSKPIKIKLGKFTPKEFDMPNFSDVATHPERESLIFFGISQYNRVNYRQVFGVGKVMRVSHGEKFDLVYMKFGENAMDRCIIVSDNHSRRQIMTLKRGHTASFYGYGRVYCFDEDNPDYNGRKAKRKKWQLYALGFQDWYVPKTLEIKRTYSDNEDVKTMTEAEEENMINFLDQFEITRGED